MKIALGACHDVPVTLTPSHPAPPPDWEARVAAVWEQAGAEPTISDDELRAALADLAAELPDGDPAGLFEVGGSYDATDDPGAAVGYYRAALLAGLGPDRRRQCVIQLASSLRALGSAEEAAELLLAELARGEADLEPQLRAFAALALAEVGREREAVGLAVGAVGSLVDRYARSLSAYGAELAPPGSAASR